MGILLISERGSKADYSTGAADVASIHKDAIRRGEDHKYHTCYTKVKYCSYTPSIGGQKTQERSSN